MHAPWYAASPFPSLGGEGNREEFAIMFNHLLAGLMTDLDTFVLARELWSTV